MPMTRFTDESSDHLTTGPDEVFGRELISGQVDSGESSTSLKSDHQRSYRYMLK
jgi:hypothetical protein